jgi:mannose/fructose/N-acetylgalactosamine-specific phosphotransferase system component IIB
MHKNNVPLEKVVSYEMARNENTQNAEAIYKSLNEEGLKSTVYGENATFINCIHLVKNYSQIANSNPYKQCYIVAEFDFVILKSIDDGIPVEKIIENVGRSESERVIAMKKMVDEKNIESVQSILSDQYTACAINALKTDPPIIK